MKVISTLSNDTDIKIIVLLLQELDFHFRKPSKNRSKYVFALTRKSYFAEVHTETSELPLSSFLAEGFDTLLGHHGPSTGCKSNLEFS